MDFQIPKIVHEEADDHRGVFVIEPLDRGFGHTFGNSLRRVLLSSLEGAAVTSVKIEGVAHEFTTLPGVREDVTDIILNLKNLICRLHGDSPEVEVRLTKKGPGSVTADSCARKGMEHGLQKVEVFVKGPGSGRETAIRSLQAAGLEILGVKDVTPQAHNGVRPRKRRRV